MQVFKLKGKLIAAAIFLVLVLFITLVIGTGILVSFIAGNEKSKLDLQLAGCIDMVNSGGSTSQSDPKPPAEVAKEQDEIVRTIEKVVKGEGVDGRAVRVTTVVGYGESTLTNLGHGDQDTAGTTNPDGSAATSYGFLQQQVSMGWGTKEQVMDPAYATRAFLHGAGSNPGLLDIPGWENMEPSAAAHKVQRNRDPGHYTEYYSYADEVIKRTGVDTTFSGKTTEDGKEPKGGGTAGDAKVQTASSGSCKKAAKWDGDLGKGEWTNPCPGCVKTSPYGQRSINGVDASNGGMHYGVDLATPGAGSGDGVEIVTPVDMKVSEIYDKDGCVFAVATADPKFGFGFCHLNRIDVSQGQVLKRGDILGIEGSRAGSVGTQVMTHLHLELYKPGADMAKWYEHHDNLDPEPVFKKKGAFPAESNA